jgi:Xaa-Pro aminopeptidase
MKRGLAVLDQSEVPVAEFHSRIDAVRDRLQETGLDAALIYGDTGRYDDISYLTNLCLYWNDGVLVVPRTGEPVMFTRLSARVHRWMRANAVLAEARSSQDLPKALVEYANEAGLARLAIVEHELWPAYWVDRMAELAPDLTLQPWDSIVRAARSLPSHSSLALLRRAGESLRQALVELDGQTGLTAESVHSRLDLRARGGGGFADVLVEPHPAPGGGLSVRVSGQLRYVWVAAARTWSSDDDVVRTAARAQQAAAGRLRPGATHAALVERAREELSALAGSVTWRLDCIDHSDLATFGDLTEPAGLPELPIQEGSTVALLVELAYADGRRVRVGDTYEVTDEGSVCLTGS